MNYLCVVGLQWGDEGKGKLVDVLAGAFDAVVRFQGGANAGHTVFIGDEKKVLHHLPTGVLHESTVGIMGNGMVIDGAKLLIELDSVDAGTAERLYLSDRAHVVLPQHFGRDRARESGEVESGEKIGTTLRGIGPAYEDKYARRGVRLGDIMCDEFFHEQLPRNLEGGGVDSRTLADFLQTWKRFRARLGHRVMDTRRVLNDFHSAGKSCLFEGAQGSLLDVDFGTYPFVTSSNASFLGLGAGCGFSPRRIEHVLGITKAYCTRVGDGPFPSELLGDAAEPLRQLGGEFGATTGRPRRCGWLDLVALAHTISVNDVDSLAVTKADVLNGMSEVPVVVAYELDGARIDHFPMRVEELQRVKPITENWPGWEQATEAQLLPFLERLSDRLGVPVSIVSNGRRRDEVLLREPFSELMGSRA